MKNEPVMKAAGVPAIFVLGYAFYKSMGWPHFTAEQEGNLWPFLAALLPLVTGLWARSKVSPV